MKPRLWLGLLLSALAFVSVSFSTGLLVLLLSPERWSAQAQLEVDWNRMPIEASGDERGAFGKLGKHAMTWSSAEFEDFLVATTANRRDVALSASDLRSMLDVDSAESSDGRRLRVSIGASADDPATALALLQIAVQETRSQFNGYRWVEGLGQLWNTSQSYYGENADGLLLLQGLSMALQDPIRVRSDSEAQRDWLTPLTWSVLAGITLGAAAATLVAFGCFLWSSRRSRSPAAPIQRPELSLSGS